MNSPFGNIVVRGARENNLKDVTLQIPKRKLTIFTGVSGSGKSSIVFDTLATEMEGPLDTGDTLDASCVSTGFDLDRGAGGRAGTKACCPVDRPISRRA